MIKYLRDNGIEAFDDASNFYEGNFKNGVRIPIYSELTDKEVSYIIKTINRFFI